MFRIKKYYLNCIILTLLLQQQSFGNPVVNLYLIDFENISNDASINWMKQGLPGMIKEHVQKRPGLSLQDKNALEKIMNNRSILLHQAGGTKNYLILGKFNQSTDEIIINIQMINIANWEEIDHRKHTAPLGALPQIGPEIGRAVEAMLTPFLPEVIQEKIISAPDLIDADLTEAFRRLKQKTINENAALAQQAKSLTQSIDVAIDNLETSMDLTIGAKGIPDALSGDETGEWSMNLNAGNKPKDNPENDANTSMLLEVLENLVKNPYKISLERPQFNYDEENESAMEVIFPVSYSLKENIIQDMLTSLPYNGLKQEGTLTIFSFDKSTFNFPQDMKNRFNRGTYRSIPVIQFFDADNVPVVVIVDTPDAYWYSMKSNKVLFIPTHQFSPLIDYTVGGWSMQVAMESVKIPVKYTFIMDVNMVDQLGRVSLKFIPVDELHTFLEKLI